MNYQKNIVITGGTDGIGLALTRKIITNKNNFVIIIGKNQDKGNKILNTLNVQNLEFINCDLLEKENIYKLSKKLQKLKKIDILVNNAGAIFSKRDVNSKSIEKTFALNHLSYFHLSLYLLEILENSNQGKIINIASNAHKRYSLNLDDLENKNNYNGWKSYCRSKLLNIYFTYSFNKMIKTNIKCNCLHPGFVNSNFGNNNISLLRYGINILKNIFAISPDEAAEAPLMLIENKDYENVKGKYFFKKKMVKSSAISYDESIAKFVWSESMKYHEAKK